MTSRTRWWTVGIVAAVALLTVAGIVVWNVASTPDPRLSSAQEDATALARAVAAHVGQSGTLPRVTVTVEHDADGHPLWGPDWRVEDRAFPRSQPSQARPFTVVGTASSWCVEAAWFPDATRDDSAPIAWVSVLSTDDTPGGARDGRCGEGYAIHLQPAWAAPAGEPGESIAVASATPGTCLVNPFSGEATAGIVDDSFQIEVADCDQQHFAEVFHVDAVPVDSGDSWAAAGESCTAAFEGYVGIPLALSRLTVEWMLPPDLDLGGVPRTYVCVLYEPTETNPVIGSALDSWF